MTPDETIEQQARREAEEPTLTVDEALRAMTPFTSNDIAEHYRARLTAAAKLRSKPQPTVEEVMDVVKVWHNYTDMVPKDAEDLMMNETQEEAYDNLRDRLTKLFNALPTLTEHE